MLDSMINQLEEFKTVHYPSLQADGMSFDAKMEEVKELKELID